MSDSASVYFIAIFCVLIPYSALKRFYGRKSDKPVPPKEKLRLAVLANLAIFGALAVAVAYLGGIRLFPAWKVSVGEVAAGLGLFLFWLSARRLLIGWLRTGVRDQSLRLLPDTWNELPIWGAISLFAGVFEEICYRGVLFQVLWHYSGSATLAGLISAMCFAVAHLTQGWRSVAFIFVLAISFQLLVFYAGSLYTAMIAHATYDFVVGILTLREGPQSSDQPVGEPA